MLNCKHRTGSSSIHQNKWTTPLQYEHKITCSRNRLYNNFAIMWCKNVEESPELYCTCVSSVQTVIALRAFPLELSFALLSWVNLHVEMITRLCGHPGRQIRMQTEISRAEIYCCSESAGEMQQDIILCCLFGSFRSGWISIVRFDEVHAYGNACLWKVVSQPCRSIKTKSIANQIRVWIGSGSISFCCHRYCMCVTMSSESMECYKHCRTGMDWTSGVPGEFPMGRPCAGR